MAKNISPGRLIAFFLLLLLAVPLTYLLYVILQYSRIPDNSRIEIEGASTLPVLRPGQEYRATTFNIGFGAYSPDFSFFMDTGVMNDGTKVRGTYGKAISRDNVMRDVNGAIKTIRDLDPDIMLFQEVDEKGSRSHNVNEKAMVEEGSGSGACAYTLNFHSAYLFYPPLDPHGANNGGLLTISRPPVEEAVRRSYPVDTSIPAKFFDLDRCFSVCYMPVSNGRTLALVNSHMSAYDEGGIIRAAQLETLNTFMKSEREKGNYVIVGGDFNHVLGSDILEAFPCAQHVPSWISVLDDRDIESGMRIVHAENRREVATCRGADIPYRKGVNYTCVIDGFIVSDNVEAKAVNIETDFAWSDHQPVLLTFTLQ